MSKAAGKIYFKDGLVLHCAYHGTSDLMCEPLYETIEEMAKHYDVFRGDGCNCGRMEPVKVYSGYGGGFWWYGDACRFCKSLSPEYQDPYVDGRKTFNGDPAPLPNEGGESKEEGK